MARIDSNRPDYPEGLGMEPPGTIVCEPRESALYTDRAIFLDVGIGYKNKDLQQM